MAKKLTLSEKQSRKEARARMAAIIREIEGTIAKLGAMPAGTWKPSKDAITMHELARHLVSKFNQPAGAYLSLSSAHGLIASYIYSRPDLFVTKGRHGGISKVERP